MKYSIYSIRNKINGKRYIGLTRDITSRWYHHIYELRRRGTIFEDPCPKSEGFIGKLIDLFSKKKS